MKIVDLRPSRWWKRPICWLCGHDIEWRLYLRHQDEECLLISDTLGQPCFCRRCGWIWGKPVDKDYLIEELKEAALKSDRMLKDHWDTMMEGRLFKRMQRVCKERGISYSELTPEEWRKLAIELALDKHNG